MNPRWLAFCRATGTSPEATWSSGLGIRFMAWVTAQIEAFGRAHPEHMAREFVAAAPAAQRAFDDFLDQVSAAKRSEALA